MPFQRLLQQISAFRGVRGCAFLDSEGEIILHAGRIDPESLRVVGAYQGILLDTARRLELSGVRVVCTMCAASTILTRAIKDGYFISVIFSPDLNFAYAQFVFEEIYRALEDAL